MSMSLKEVEGISNISPGERKIVSPPKYPDPNTSMLIAHDTYTVAREISYAVMHLDAALAHASLALARLNLQGAVMIPSDRITPLGCIDNLTGIINNAHKLKALLEDIVADGKA